jgi:hypothetical protein
MANILALTACRLGAGNGDEASQYTELVMADAPVGKMQRSIGVGKSRKGRKKNERVDSARQLLKTPRWRESQQVRRRPCESST